MTDLERTLAELWGAAAQFSEFQRGDIVRYLVGLATYTGTIVWIAAPGPSHVEGHPDLATRYIIERHGWTGFPDVALSCDILSLDGPQEPVLVRCPWCQKFHYEETAKYCPMRPRGE